MTIELNTENLQNTYKEMIWNHHDLTNPEVIKSVAKDLTKDYENNEKAATLLAEAFTAQLSVADLTV